MVKPEGPPHKKKRPVGAGLSLDKFAAAGVSKYDKRKVLERLRKEKVIKRSKYSKLKHKLEAQGALKPLQVKDSVAELEQLDRRQAEDAGPGPGSVGTAVAGASEGMTHGAKHQRHSDHGHGGRYQDHGHPRQASEQQSHERKRPGSGEDNGSLRHSKGAGVGQPAPRSRHGRFEGREDAAGEAAAGGRAGQLRRDVGLLQGKGTHTPGPAACGDGHGLPGQGKAHAGHGKAQQAGADKRQGSGQQLQHHHQQHQQDDRSARPPGRKPNSLARLAQKVAQEREEQRRAKEEAQKAREARLQHIAAVEKQRKEEKHKFFKRNAKGQPLMRYRMEKLLAKIQGL